MPKRGRYGDDEQGGTSKPKLREALYLVLDDWHSGYSIRKVNLLPGGGGNNQQTHSPRPLPKPLNRLMAPRDWSPSPKYFTSAFGTRILAMLASGRDPDVFPMLDVRSLGFSFGPGRRRPLNPIYLPVGKKLLFTLSIGAPFEMLCLEESRRPPPGRSCGMEWSWEDLAEQPFDVYDVTSYSVHADKHTIVVSTKDDDTEATFAFDTVKLEWKQLGNWVLPFNGRGHFDRRLKAFVGFSKDPDTFGQLYSCRAPSSYTGEGQCTPPSQALCKEKLFSQDPSHRHVSATLVYMGRQSKFCLVECLSIEDNQQQQRMNEDDCPDQALVKETDVGCCIYRFTTFSLSRETNGDLTTRNSCQVEYYRVPNATTKSFLVEDPVAFWM